MVQSSVGNRAGGARAGGAAERGTINGRLAVDEASEISRKGVFAQRMVTLS